MLRRNSEPWALVSFVTKVDQVSGASRRVTWKFHPTEAERGKNVAASRRRLCGTV